LLLLLRLDPLLLLLLLRLDPLLLLLRLDPLLLLLLRLDPLLLLLLLPPRLELPPRPRRSCALAVEIVITETSEDARASTPSLCLTDFDFIRCLLVRLRRD